MTIPAYDVIAIRYAKQDLRSEGHMFMGGDHNKMIQGLDFFTYVLRGGGKTWTMAQRMTAKRATRMGRK